MQIELVCNFKKCRKELNSKVWATVCSHVFCYEHGVRQFEKSLVCPACETALTGKYDAMLVDVNPTEDYKSMVLAGQRPDVVMEICSRALNFWSYQLHQELLYQKYIVGKANEKMATYENRYENLLQKAKSELEQTKKLLSANKAKLDAATKQIADLTNMVNEKNRHCQKLRSHYESLRHKLISSSIFEETKNDRKKMNCSFPITTASDFIRQAPERHGLDVGHESGREGEFVLRPASTPVVSQNPYNSFLTPRLNPKH